MLGVTHFLAAGFTLALLLVLAFGQLAQRACRYAPFGDLRDRKPKPRTGGLPVSATALAALPALSASTLGPIIE